ncbi:sulfate/molybdate ABC transporter ATP-binding protein [Myxococcus sp. RHSTA-1-4]|uniref:sulfate/molybdate ABC transporter ATP-binding protein n=1 Tax=Myxococcus sp. RHSTA-1-4 TaxID=2874601 RepID=UPI001CBC4678|nr:ABC transporter ATP-binding protein [Myxococcus sp. RHSTA-1-4]MBZ4419280.1 ABC transporter ATP-binding protein [Myxococcus sp. RHSTA-1-4]
MSVTVEHLTRRFPGGSHPAAEDVSFHAPAGAVTALLGPSGSGKTTVLRAIAGLEEADAGRVSICGEDCTRMPPQRRGVGFVFQGYALFEHLTVRGNVGFGLRVRGVSRKERDARVDELLELVQLQGYGERYPSQLSGGQRQRVAFARALATRPRVLLLDEPFAALDTRVRVELRAWLRELHEQTHVTTLLVTHDQEEALELAQQVVVMHEGRVRQVGTSLEVYDRPATPFVASFIGNANVLRGHVQGGRAALGGLTLDAPGGAPDGARVHAFVRPHEVRIARAVEEPSGAHAVISALTRVGDSVKLSLQLAGRDTLMVHMAHAELEALGLTQGERVAVGIRNARLFVEEHAG